MKETTKCPKCGNGVKHVQKPYQIKTRDERRRIINIENLLVIECTVCDYSEIPKASEKNIQAVKDMVKAGMEQLAQQEMKLIMEKEEGKLTTILRRFIG